MKIHGPVSSFSQSLIAQLGGVAVEMSMEELGSLRLMERRSIAAVGAISSWSQRQVRLSSPTWSPPSVSNSCFQPARCALRCGAELHQAESEPVGLQHAGGDGPPCVRSQNHGDEPVQCCGVQVSL